MCFVHRFISLVIILVIVIVHHISYYLHESGTVITLGTIFRTLWGSKHSFHGNVSETHIDKRIGAAVFSLMTNESSKAERGFSWRTQLNAANIFLKTKEEEEGSTRAEESV